MKKKPVKPASPSRRSPDKSKKPAAPAKRSSSALSVEDLAQVLRQAGAKEITAASIRSDLNAGAPRNKDGTIDIVQYAAWLVSQAAK